MQLDDPTLPSVVHLTGSSADEVLAPAVAAAGGTIHSCRAVQVQYRPGHDLVVRYRCDVTWAGGRRRRETLLAATTSAGVLRGTVPVHARSGDRELEVSVWRWPFDPVLVGLETAVTSSAVRAVIDPRGRRRTEPVEIDVVAYRPTERAVIRIHHGDDIAYMKVVAPSAAAALAGKHHWLRSAGLPVPEVMACDESMGLLVLAEVPGPTLREHVKRGTGAFPTPDQILALGEALAATAPPPASIPVGRVACRLTDALGHADLLRAVAPGTSSRLGVLTDRIEAQIAVGEPADTVVHGDLHEAQLVVDDAGAVTGLLDVDDVGYGAAATDLATLLAHLRFRAAVTEDRTVATWIRDHVATLRAAGASRHDAASLDVRVAAVLVGLATGPFRIQRPTWRRDIDAVVADALELVEERE